MNKQHFLRFKSLIRRIVPYAKRSIENKDFVDKYIQPFKKDLIRYGILCKRNLNSLDDFQRYLPEFNYDFFNLEQRKNTRKVLSVEVNRGHDVIRPSIFQYFSALGYEVDFLLAEFEGNVRWNFFERFECLNPRTVTGSYLFIDAVLSMDIINDYDFILLNTHHVCSQNHMHTNRNCLDSLFLNTGMIPRPKHGFLSIPPHPSLFNLEAEEALVKTQQLDGIPVLSHLGYRGLPMLSSHHFGQVNITTKTAENKFLATGNIQPHQKNHNMLIDAAERLLGEGIKNFKIIVNGSHGVLNIPHKLRSSIEVIGDNKPAKLFKLIEECDFITALLDSTNEWQRNQYGHGTCSVAFMYSLGFAKPYLIEDYFLTSLGIDQRAAISYSNNNLYSAMKRAILLNEAEYKQIQANILTEAQQRSQRSLDDIQQLLHRVTSLRFD